MRTPLALGLLVVAACSIPQQAWAELRFCNRTGSKTTVAIAYVEKDAPGTTTNGHRGVTLEGWWTFAPGECAQVSGIHVGNHWVYYHAYAGDGKWQGSSLLCVPSRAFTTGGSFRRPGDACPGGTQLKGFKRIESEARTYTMSLTD
jgi:uncharacterized membrane protein